MESESGSEQTYIYTTDTVLSTLMTVKSSMFPWDISVVKQGNQLFFEPSAQNKVSYVDGDASDGSGHWLDGCLIPWVRDIAEFAELFEFIVWGEGEV